MEEDDSGNQGTAPKQQSRCLAGAREEAEGGGCIGSDGEELKAWEK